VTIIGDLSQTSPPLGDSADQRGGEVAIGLFGAEAFGTSAGRFQWRVTSFPTSTVPSGWVSAVVRTSGPRPEPIWAAAQRAFAEGRLRPPPRRPTLRPESDYETDPTEAVNFAEPQYQGRRRGYW
jgi:hypothetical protein